MVLESRPLLHVLFRQWSSCRSRSMCLVPIHFSWKDTNGLQVLGFVNPWRNPSRYDSLIRWLLQWYIAHSGTSLVNVYYCSLLIEKCWALRNWKFVYHEDFCSFEVGFPKHFWFSAGFPQTWCMNILFMHLFVYMCHGHFSLSEYVIMLDIDLCRKIPGHNKCTKWTCNQQRVSLWYPAWPTFHLMNSCLAGNFLLKDTITSVVYVLLASSLCIRNCHEISRYKTFESRFTICLLVCLF
jgi:hypothetical protein